MSQAEPLTWAELRTVAEPVTSSARRLAGTLLPGLVVAGLLALLGRREMAVVVLVVSIVLGASSLRWPAVGHRVATVARGIGRAVGAALSFVLMLIVEVAVFLPVSVLLWLLRRDPLDGRRRVGGGRWEPNTMLATAAAARRTFGHEPGLEAGPSQAGRARRLVPLAAGGLAVLVAVDLAVGAVWHNEPGPNDAGTARSAEGQIALATADAPWFPDYRRELATVAYDFAPFVLSSPRDTPGPYINISGGVRESRQAPGATDAPVVYFFGGSPVWGEGQRDDHTIPSEVARLAAADGVPIQVVNAGQRGDTNFAAVQRFEQTAAHRDTRPDLVVFADGLDDITVQLQGPADQPSQYGLADAQRIVHEDHRSLWDRYRETSLFNKVANRIRGLVAVQQAGAATSESAQAPVTTTTTTTTTGSALNTVSAERVGLATAGVYARGVRLADHIAATHGVPVRYFWLPAEASGEPGSAYTIATDHLPDGVTDVSDALDGADDPVYLDAIHTNELGARLVARAMYRHLRPTLQGLARSSAPTGPGSD